MSWRASRRGQHVVERENRRGQQVVVSSSWRARRRGQHVEESKCGRGQHVVESKSSSCWMKPSWTSGFGLVSSWPDAS
eukprot:g31953.t1